MNWKKETGTELEIKFIHTSNNNSSSSNCVFVCQVVACLLFFHQIIYLSPFLPSHHLFIKTLCVQHHKTKLPHPFTGWVTLCGAWGQKKDAGAEMINGTADRSETVCQVRILFLVSISLTILLHWFDYLSK